MRHSHTLRAVAMAAAVALTAVAMPPVAGQDGKKPGAGGKGDGGGGGAAVAALRTLDNNKAEAAGEVIDATQLPADVVQALQKAAPEAAIQGITRLARGGGETYTLRLLVAGKPRVASFFHALTGTIVEALAANELPAPVLDAFKKVLPAGLPAQFNKSTVVAGPDEGMTAYMPVVEQRKGDGQKGARPPVVTVSADGQTLTVEETLDALPQAVAAAVQRQYPQSNVAPQTILRLTVNGVASYSFVLLTQDGRKLGLSSTEAGEVTAPLRGDGAGNPAAGRQGDQPAKTKKKP